MEKLFNKYGDNVLSLLGLVCFGILMIVSFIGYLINWAVTNDLAITPIALPLVVFSGISIICDVASVILEGNFESKELAKILRNALSYVVFFIVLPIFY